MYETRVALVENGQVAELYLERCSDRGIAGNIYRGLVVRVLPGMQAAFVDIGLDKAAFLYVSDVQRPIIDLEQLFQNSAGMEAEVEELEEVSEPIERELKGVFPGNRNHADIRIEDRLQECQEILVQVAKEPLGSKGARITTNISLPGRNLVLMPMVEHIGVSRRIENEKERRRLRDLVGAMKPPACGFIVRTAAEGVEAEKLKAEIGSKADREP